MKLHWPLIAVVALLGVGLSSVCSAAIGKLLDRGELVDEWHCKDPIDYPAPVLVRALVYEKGYFNGDVIAAGVTNPAVYSVQGFQMRWDFGSDGDGGAPYSLVLQPNGDASYYDFTGVPKGEKVSASQRYKCKKVK
ncbi:hypothetical protein [Alcanivorax sp.]|uniref:hypothetical protein n=1 Tax=Alcanivorax sp. TaxID=1872427 RepID=UPI0025C58FE3|nr:hypothetical protein [Alcanivorax sp.]